MTLFDKNIAYLQKSIPNHFSDIDLKSSLDEIRNACDAAGITLENLLFFNLDAESIDWSKIKFVFLDVDGVMTEGGMFYTEDGDEFKRFDTKDGMAIKEAIKAGVDFGIISSGVNKKIIQHRADMFGIKHVYVGTEPKLKIAERWLDNLDLTWNQVGYIGDDINDLQMFEKAGITACPADAVIPIRKAANFILESKGGHGCVREFVSYLPNLKNIL